MDEIKSFIDKIKKMPEFKKVIAVILYGSYLEKHGRKSDIDLCFVYRGDKREQIRFRLKLLSIANKKFDIQIYDLLPLYIKKDVSPFGKCVLHWGYRPSRGRKEYSG